MNIEPTVAVSFGEILFDRFQDGDYLGGAPLNFAWYLRQFGVPVAMISAVGHDVLGSTAIEALVKAGIKHDWVSRRHEPTGTAGVSIRNGQPVFGFSENSAWDQITLPVEAGHGGSLIYFGTLSQRSSANRVSLEQLLQAPFRHRFFDVNLRPGHYSDDVIKRGITAASAVKMNLDEWQIVSAVTRIASPEEMLDHFDLSALVITNGPDGAELHVDGEVYRSSSPPVDQVDSVGAGDAFCSVMAAACVLDVPLHRALDIACEAGAFVASRRGAQVLLPSDIVDHLQEERS